MKTAVILLITLVFSLSAGAGTIQYEGSSTIGKYISDAAKVYEKSTFSISDDSESLGGETCVAEGSCELGGVARAVRPEILDRGVRAVTIGKDAISVIVNVQNPVNNLSTKQLKGIFSGEISNWSEVGGVDMPIRPYIVKPASATRQVFRYVILPASNYSDVTVVRPDRKVVAKVIHDRGGIGQISFAFIKDIKGVRPVAVDGQKAAVDNPAYPIIRPLILLTKGAPSPEVQTFLDWTLSPEGQAVVKNRFVGVK